MERRIGDMRSGDLEFSKDCILSRLVDQLVPLPYGLAYPSDPLHLISNHILLLRPNDHPRPNDPHECNDLLSRKGVFVYEVGWMSTQP